MVVYTLIDTTEHMLMLNLMTVTFTQAHRWEKAKTSAPMISQSLMEFCKLLRLAGLMIFMLIFFCLMNVKARESYLHDFVNNNNNKKQNKTKNVYVGLH